MKRPCVLDTNIPHSISLYSHWNIEHAHSLIHHSYYSEEYNLPYEDNRGEEGAENPNRREYQWYQRPRTRPGYNFRSELDATGHRGIRCVTGITIFARVVEYVSFLSTGDATPTAGFLRNDRADNFAELRINQNE